MSEREVRRVEVLNEVQSGRRTVAAAASVVRQRAAGIPASGPVPGERRLRAGAQGLRPGFESSHNPGVRKYAVELVMSPYTDFGADASH